MKTSDTTKELFTALTKFRAQLKQPLKDANNPFFKSKYVPLENVVETLDEAIMDTGLSYLQEIAENRVNTIITHDSGEYLIIGGSEVKPVKPDPQALGSAITYAKRYSLCCAFGITSDEDDDGNAASAGKSPQTQTAKPDNHVNRNKEIEAAINNCQSLIALQQAWKGLNKQEKLHFAPLKDKKKEALEKALEEQS